MKRLINLTLVLAIILTLSFSAFGEEASTVFSPTITNVLYENKTANAIYSSESSRIGLTIWLATDASLYDDDNDITNSDWYADFLNNSTYVGEADGILYVVGRTEDFGIAILYEPLSQMAAFTFNQFPLDATESLADSILNTMLHNFVGENYSKNDSTLIRSYFRDW